MVVNSGYIDVAYSYAIGLIPGLDIYFLLHLEQFPFIFYLLIH